VLLVDTAGRLHVDEDLMQELVSIKAKVNPAEILFVADAMTGQEAVNVAQSFDERLDITGVVLTKMDGDARGGAALSIKSVTGKNVKFVGMGEKISELELFHPDRIAGRILGMGDMLTLIEKTQGAIEQRDAEELARKMQKAEFDLEDFLSNMKRVKKLGSLDGIMKMIPGLSGLRQKIGDASMPEKELSRTEAIISSMTMAERRNPKILNGSRKLRIAKGSGTAVAQVNQLLKQFEGMKVMMQNMLGGKKGKKDPLRGRSGMGGMGGGLGLPGMGALGEAEGEMPPQGLSKTAQKKKKMLRKAKKNKKR
jgi:signal recognition particle subunit SRP54